MKKADAPAISRKEREVLVLDEIKSLIDPENASKDQILQLLAAAYVTIEDLSMDKDFLVSKLVEHQRALNFWTLEPEEGSPSIRSFVLRHLAEEGNDIVKTLLHGMEMEKSSIAKLAGKAGANKRHEAMRKLKQWAVEKFKAGSWPSTLAASHELKDDALAYGKSIGASLTPYNAQRTIYNWLPAEKKNTG